MERKIRINPAGRLFLLCFTAYMFSYFGRYNLSACLDLMVKDEIFSEVFGGYIQAAFLICYGIGQFINGRLAARIPPRIMIASGLFGSGICNLLMTFSSSSFTGILIVIWGLNGYCNAMLWSSIIRIFTEWLDEDERKKAGAHISPSIPAGMLTCYLITFVVLKNLNWRWVFAVCGTLLCVGGLIWTVGTFLIRSFISQAIKHHAEESGIVNSSGDRPAASLTLRLFISTGLIVLVFASLFNGALKDAVTSWVPQYLIDSFGFTPSNASLVSTLLPLFSVAGPYFGIWINRRFFNNECSTVGVLFLISAVCNAGMIFLGAAAPFAAVIMLAVSMACMWGVNTMLLTFVPFHFGGIGLSSAVTGTLNCIIFIGSSVFTYLYRIVSSAYQWNNTVILWFSIAAASSALCFFFAKVWKRRRPSAQ